MTKNELIKNINLSLQNLNISKVILFGSWANYVQTNNSDVDLLVVTNDEYEDKREIPFVRLSESSLEKEWSCEEDSVWDNWAKEKLKIAR